MKADHSLAAAWHDVAAAAAALWADLNRRDDRPGTCTCCGSRIDPKLTECLPCLADRPW